MSKTEYRRRKAERVLKSLHQTVHFNWSTIKEVKGGVPSVISEPSMYINTGLSDVNEVFEGVSSRYWRDVVNMDLIESNFQKYVQEKPEVNVNERVAERAWKRVEEHFSHLKGKLRPSSIGESAKGMPKPTSPGLPFVRQGFATKREAMGSMKREVRQWWRQAARGKSRFKTYPCMAGARRVIREYPKNKPRLVWVYPGSVTLLEGQFAQPVFEALGKAEWIGWSVNWLDGGKSRSRLFPPRGCSAVASIDFASFDSQVLARFISRSFSILRSCFDLSAEEHKIFDFIVDYFIHTPILLYDRVAVKHRGVPSGSYFTQMIDTMVNMFYCFYVDETQLSRDGSRLLDKGHIWLGDDSRLLFGDWYGASDFPKTWISVFRVLGAEVSEDKFNLVVFDDEESKTHVGTFLSRTLLTGFPHLGFDFNKFVAQVLIPEDRDMHVTRFAGRLVGLVWAYGFDRRAYDILEMLYPFGIEPVYTARALRYITYVLGVHDVDMSYFPSYDQVKLRYFGYV